MSLNIVVLAKQVPDTRNVGKDAMKADGTINRAALPAIFNPEDLNALEQALQLKEQNPGSKITLLTMGLPRAAEMIRESLYRGGDTGIVLTDRALAGADTLATSYALATAIRHIGKVDIILGGRQAIDGDTAQVGPQVAEKLGMPQVTYAESVKVEGGKAVIKRRIERGFETGYDAVKESQKKATVKPENYKSGTFFYQYNENLVYEIYAQPYHLTDIVLERGETVKGPASAFFSEDESVWELTAAVSIDSETGEEVQHFFVKPAFSKLDSSLIIITDRRVYHLRVKSFADTHMAIVKFTYPGRKNVYAKSTAEKSRSVENDFIRISNPELLSFDYKMKYSMFKKPEFLPKRVYDDGQSTYIQVDEIVLQKKLPVLFNEKNEIENYSVKKNVFVVPRLVNKITLRLGKQKVVIEKKKTSQKIAEKIAAEEEAQVGK